MLLSQMNYSSYKGQWILPGGALEPMENPAEAAERETLEETGLVIKAQNLLAVRHKVFLEGKMDIYWVFLGLLESLQPQVSEKNNLPPEVKWPAEELICVKFWKIADALKDESVRPLTREFIKLGVEMKDFQRWRLRENPQFEGSDQFFIYSV